MAEDIGSAPGYRNMLGVEGILTFGWPGVERVTPEAIVELDKLNGSDKPKDREVLRWVLGFEPDSNLRVVRRWPGEAALEPDMSLDAQASEFQRLDRIMPARDQLAFTADVWAEWGFWQPDLSEEQVAHLHEILRANRTHRVMPAPLLDGTERSWLLLPQLRGYQKGDSEDDWVAVSLPTEEDPAAEVRAYAKLLRRPGETVRESMSTYTLMYRTSSYQPHMLVSRDEYIQTLLDRGYAIPGPDGKPWTFAVMDINEQKKPKAQTHEQMAVPLATPESLMLAQYVRRLAGAPAYRRTDVTVANEVVCRHEGIYPAEQFYAWVRYKRGEGVALHLGYDGQPNPRYWDRQFKPGLPLLSR